MQLLIISPSSYSVEQVTYAFHEIGGKPVSVKFRTGTVVREKTYQEDQSVYHFINRFTNTLSAARQNKIYEIYAQIRKLLDRFKKQEFVDDELRILCSQLAAQYPIEEVTKWLTQPGILVWPGEADAPRSYENAGSKKYPREKTYLLDDYQNLLALTLQLRIFTPIMAEYQEIALEEKIVSRMLVDVVRLRLIEESGVVLGEGWRKLKEYTLATLRTNNKAAKAIVMEVMSEEDFPEWLLANVVMRKLSIQSLRSDKEGDSSAFVVRHICCHIIEALRKAERDHQQPKATSEGSSGGDDDGHLSQFEAVRAKESLPNGDTTFIQIMMEDAHRLAHDLDPTLPKALLNEFLDLYDFVNFIPRRCQSTLALWVLAPEVSPRSEVDMYRVNMSQNIAVAAAILWHHGHKELATIMTSADDGPVRTENVLMPSNARSRTPMYTQLTELFPYHIRTKPNDRPYRPVVDTVNMITQEIQERTWVPSINARMRREVPGILIESEQFSMLDIPADLPEMLFRLVVEVASRPLRRDSWAEADRIAREHGLM